MDKEYVCLCVLSFSETRKLVIPPHLAYGDQGHPPVIPGTAPCRSHDCHVIGVCYYDWPTYIVCTCHVTIM